MRHLSTLLVASLAFAAPAFVPAETKPATAPAKPAVAAPAAVSAAAEKTIALGADQIHALTYDAAGKEVMRYFRVAKEGTDKWKLVETSGPNGKDVTPAAAPDAKAAALDAWILQQLGFRATNEKESKSPMPTLTGPDGKTYQFKSPVHLTSAAGPNGEKPVKAEIWAKENGAYKSVASLNAKSEGAIMKMKESTKPALEKKEAPKPVDETKSKDKVPEKKTN